MKRRLLSLLMCLCMALTLLPRLAWAAEREETPLGEEAVAAPVAEKAPAAPVRAQTLDVGDPMEPNPDIVEWLQNRTLKVCGVTVTPENAHDILAGTSYYNGAEPAQFACYVRGDTKRFALRLTDLNVDDSAQDTKLDHVIEYIGTGAPDDVLYVEIWNLLSEESTFVSSARNAVDISVEDGSLDLSGFHGDATNTLNLEGTMGPRNLEVRNGDLHIHDITLTADGWGEDGIYVSNGRLTVSGEDTVVTTTAGTGRGGSTPIDDLKSQTQLTLDKIFILEDGLAITSPAGAKAVLTVQEPKPEYDINYYSHTVAFTDEDGNRFDGADVVISKPHAHNGVTFDHTLASDAQTVGDSDTGTTIRYLLLDGEPWVNYDAQTIDDLVKNDLPAGSYLLTDNIDFDKGLEVKAGAVNLCLNGHKLTYTGNADSIFKVESGGTLNICDCNGANGYNAFESPVTNETVTVNGGLITRSQPHDDVGGLVRVYKGGTFHLYGGTLAGGKNATEEGGYGAVRVEGTFHMYGGEICHNRYGCGGGLNVNGGDFTLHGGSFHHNYASYDDGGAICLDSGHVTIKGGSITDNKAAQRGGAITSYWWSERDNSVLTLSGNPTIANNTVNGKPGNIHLFENCAITIGENFAPTQPIGVSGLTDKDENLVPPTAGSPQPIGAAGSGGYAQYFTADVAGQTIMDKDGKLYLAVHTHAVCGASCGHAGADVHANTGFTKALTGDADGKLYIDGEALSTETEYDSTFYTIPSGSYYLAGDVEIDTPIRIGTSQNTGGQAVALCFNGHTIHYTENKFTGNFITVYAPFTTCDCQEGQTGGVSGDPTNSTYSLLSVCAPTTLYGGAFTREEYGYGINMRYVNARVTVDGATIKTKGVAINGEGPSVGVTIKSGRVESTAGTAVVLNKSPRFTMEGGTLIGKMQGANIECTEVSDGVTGCGTISGGTIQSELYGLFLYVDKPLTLTGAPVIKGGESFGDIVFSPNRSNMLNVGDLGDQVYTVTCWAGTGFITENNPYAISVAASTDQSGHFKTLSHDTAHSIRDAVDSDGNHTVQIYKAHSHPVCGKTCAHEGTDTHEAVTYTALTQAVVDGYETHYGQTDTGVGSTSFEYITIPAGHYYLEEDISTDKVIKLDGAVDLCFNGNTLTSTCYNEINVGALVLGDKAVLNTCDCQGGGRFSSEGGGSGPAFCVTDVDGVGMSWSATVNLYGGTIYRESTGGLAVEVDSDCVLTVDGATLHGPGEALRVSGRTDGSTVNIKSGTLTSSGNYSSTVEAGARNFTVTGGSITNTGKHAALRISYPMTISGAPVIRGGEEGDLYLVHRDGKITVGDGFTGSYTVFVSSPGGITEATPWIITAPANGDQSGLFTLPSTDEYKALQIKDVVDEGTGKHTVQIVRKPAHVHVWATAWSSDANGHWHACTAEGCDITDYAACGETGAAYGTHVYTNDQDITCNTCGYTRSVALYGTASITGTAKIGGTLTASVSGAPSGVTLTYQWTVEGGDGTVLGTAAAYTPGAAAVVGKNLVCTVTTDDAHYTGSIRATTGAVALGDRTAPMGLFTVTDIPVGGTTGSIAVSADADKLEYRKVTDPATETWTAVTASGDTATLSQLTGGSYEFRYKATDTHDASPATTVQVRVLTSQAKALTIASGIEHGTVTKQRDMVNPGDTVTLAVQPDEGYELETITVRYTEGGVEKTITPTVKADNPAHYTFTMPDAAVSVTATFTALPPQGDVTGEVEVKPDTPAVTVDEDTLKDLAGEVQEGESVTVKLTVEKQDSPTDKDELEAIISGKKDDVLYLDLSLLKQVNDAAPQPITDTGDKVLEIAVDYDFTGKKDVTVYRKHGENDAEKLTKLTARPAGDFQDGTFYADGVGKVYIYASKFSTYAIGYTEETTSPVTPPSRPSSRPSRRPTQAEEPTWPFVDVTEQDWHYEGVKYVYEKGLMEGTSDTTFAPGMDTSRAMIATILWRLSGSPEPEAGLTYPDCKAGSWYAKAVAWGTEAGILKGYDTGDFGPNDPITREQMALMLWRYAGSPKTSADLDKFVDGKSVSDWVYPAMEWAVEQGILTGKGGDLLDPQGQATRAEAAAMLQRFCERKK